MPDLGWIWAQQPPPAFIYILPCQVIRYNPYSSENEEEEEGTSSHAFLKDLHHLAKLRGVASNEVALALKQPSQPSESFWADWHIHSESYY